MTLRSTHLLALFVVAGAMVAPSSGRAACGHYVISGARLDEQRKRSQLQTPTSHQPAAPMPCQGPGCSQGRALPVLPSLPAPVEAEEWACPLLPLLILAEPTARREREADALRPQRLARDLDPPPRSCSLG
jgi:hypothetical protein